MTAANDDQCRNLLNSLRKIIQAIDQHSIVLQKKFGLTGPQLVTLQAVSFYAPISVTRISKVVSLSQASVTDITQRLEKKGIFPGPGDCEDKRKTEIDPNSKRHPKFWMRFPPAPGTFYKKVSELERWEQLMIESAFERVVSMMSAQDFNVAPIMITGEDK